MADLFENLVFEKEDIIRFPEGIPGFEKYDEFVLVKVPDLGQNSQGLTNSIRSWLKNA